MSTQLQVPSSKAVAIVCDGAAVNGLAVRTVKELLYPDVLDVSSGGDLMSKSLESSPNGGLAFSAIVLQRD